MTGWHCALRFGPDQFASSLGNSGPDILKANASVTRHACRGSKKRVMRMLSSPQGGTTASHDTLRFDRPAARLQLETIPLNALDAFDGLAHRGLQSVQSVSCLHLGPSKTIPFILEPDAQSERPIGIDLTQLAI